MPTDDAASIPPAPPGPTAYVITVEALLRFFGDPDPGTLRSYMDGWATPVEQGDVAYDLHPHDTDRFTPSPDGEYWREVPQP